MWDGGCDVADWHCGRTSKTTCRSRSLPGSRRRSAASKRRINLESVLNTVTLLRASLAHIHILFCGKQYCYRRSGGTVKHCFSSKVFTSMFTPFVIQCLSHARNRTNVVAVFLQLQNFAIVLMAMLKKSVFDRRPRFTYKFYIGQYRIFSTVEVGRYFTSIMVGRDGPIL